MSDVLDQEMERVMASGKGYHDCIDVLRRRFLLVAFRTFAGISAALPKRSTSTATRWGASLTGWGSARRN